MAGDDRSPFLWPAALRLLPLFPIPAAPKDPPMGGGVCLMGLPCISKQMQYSKYQTRIWNALLPFALTLPPLISLHPFGFVKPQEYILFTFAWEPETYPPPQGPSHILLSLRGRREGFRLSSFWCKWQLLIQMQSSGYIRLQTHGVFVCLDSCKSKLSIQMQSFKTAKYEAPDHCKKNFLIVWCCFVLDLQSVFLYCSISLIAYELAHDIYDASAM